MYGPAGWRAASDRAQWRRYEVGSRHPHCIIARLGRGERRGAGAGNDLDSERSARYAELGRLSSPESSPRQLMSRYDPDTNHER